MEFRLLLMLRRIDEYSSTSCIDVTAKAKTKYQLKTSLKRRPASDSQKLFIGLNRQPVPTIAYSIRGLVPYPVHYTNALIGNDSWVSHAGQVGYG